MYAKREKKRLSIPSNVWSTNNTIIIIISYDDATLYTGKASFYILFTFILNKTHYYSCFLCNGAAADPLYYIFPILLLYMHFNGEWRKKRLLSYLE